MLSQATVPIDVLARGELSLQAAATVSSETFLLAGAVCGRSSLCCIPELRILLMSSALGLLLPPKVACSNICTYFTAATPCNSAALTANKEQRETRPHYRQHAATHQQVSGDHTHLCRPCGQFNRFTVCLLLLKPPVRAACRYGCQNRCLDQPH